MPNDQANASFTTTDRHQDVPVLRRILMVAACPFPANRGTPARILRMSEALASHGHEVHVVTYHLGGGADDKLPVHVHRIASVPTYRKMDPGPSVQKLLVLDPMLAVKVIQLTKKLKPDVIHAHHFEGLLVSLPAKKIYSTPVVLDMHVLLDGELEYYRTGIPKTLRRRLARSLDRRLPALATGVIAVSDEIRDIMITQHDFSESQITVVPNGIEAEFFEGDPAKFPKTRARRILFTGNLASYQGTESMLEAFSLVISEYDDALLTIATSSDTADFMDKARRIGVDAHIEFVDCEVADLPHMIASADVVLNPRTRCPGTPMKLLNYMAGAAPIVSFEGSAKYLKNEENALVIKDDDIDGFANGILRLLHDELLARQLGRAAREFARTNLNWELNSRVIEQVYDRQIDGEHCG